MNTNNQIRTNKSNEAKEQNVKSKRGARLKGKAPSGAPSQKADQIKVGLDMGLEKCVFCRQVDRSLAEAPRVKDPKGFREWLKEQKELAREVVVCYEAGLFGFELARWVESQGMKCLVMAPIKLDEKNSRVETDKLNARDICSRLDRYLAGNTRSMTVCRTPKREEELARHQTRQRQQLLDTRKALEAQGRCLLWQFGHLEEGTNWWERIVWEGLPKRINDPKVVSGLSRLRAVILEVEVQLKELVQELAEQAKTDLPEPLRENLPLGMGWLSILILTREVMDWKRFSNRRQVAGFNGLVPSEGSTGKSIRQGSITKVGNPRMRTITIEMAWRLVRYQPNYHALKPWREVLGSKKRGSRTRKKAIVAVARVLSVDLWRLATGQTTMEKLGLK